MPDPKNDSPIETTPEELQQLQQIGKDLLPPEEEPKPVREV